MVKFQRQGLTDGWKTGFTKGLRAKGGTAIWSAEEAEESSHTQKGGKGERYLLPSSSSSEAE